MRIDVVLAECQCASRSDELPVFAFTVFDVSRRLREQGWQVPRYTFPANHADLAVLRIVGAQRLTHDLAELLLADLGRLLAELQAQPGPLHAGGDATGFHH